MRENVIDEVKKLTKEKFDLDRVLSTANELKYTGEIKKVLQRQIDEPGSGFCSFLF